MNPVHQQYTKVLAVSSDRNLLGSLVPFLQVIGYNVTSTSEPSQTPNWIAAWQPDVCLIDARNRSEWDEQQLERLNSICDGDNVKIILLSDAANRRGLVKLLGVRVDDIVEAGVWGELLARLKTIVQLREFEARLASESGLNPTTQLPTFDAFQQRATELWAGKVVGACLHLLLDSSAAQVELGKDSWKRTMNTTAQLLQGRSPRPLAMTGISNGNYQLLLDQDVDAVQYAEGLRGAFADAGNASHPGNQPFSVSIGIAHGAQHTSLDNLLRAAKRAAQCGRKRGGNCCMLEADCVSISEQWQQEATAARIYATTTAQHLMTPFTWSLRDDETLRHAANIFKHTGLNWLPVLDEEEKYVGLLSPGQVAGEPSQPVREACRDNVPQIPAELSFDALMAELQRSHTLVVVRDGQPWGIVEAGQLAQLDQLVPAVPVNEDASVEERLLLREPVAT